MCGGKTVGIDCGGAALTVDLRPLPPTFPSAGHYSSHLSVLRSSGPEAVAKLPALEAATKAH